MVQLYMPAAYMTIEVTYFLERSNVVKIVGIFASTICAISSLILAPLCMYQFGASCVCMMEYTEWNWPPNINRQEDTEIKDETESRQGEAESRQEEIESLDVETGSRHQETYDPKLHPKRIIDSFKDLTRAWSPMIAITFATEGVVLISAGFAFSNLLIKTPVLTENKNPHEMYLWFRNCFMLAFFLSSILYILGVSWLAEETHKTVKEFGSKVR